MSLSSEVVDRGSEHEEVRVWRDSAAGYVGVIAIHSTALGPAVGGTRLWRYAELDAAVEDALLLSRGMTYKNALAGLPLGGGKAVILAPSTPGDWRALFRAHGRCVESFGGRFKTAEDVGTSPRDMEWVREETRHVAGLASDLGDPSPYTARGVLRAMQAAASLRWNSASLAGRRVAVQGSGHVGAQLVLQLHEAGAHVVVSDLEPARADALLRLARVRAVGTEEILSVEADIFAPCALGGTLDAETVRLLRAEVVAGAANNQLRDAAAGEALAARGILYVPDYLANAGGVISGCHTLLGWSAAAVNDRIERIFDATLDLLRSAREEGLRPEVIADRIVARRLAGATAA